ncbi:unnamed protein product [Adineta ricciae]|uniref:Uncharacterized protein n=1 Tax=Adineta ricciae TaxID=249248 RepID=A0A813NVW6_ADIRI|nr:unnamed protein product [Adineta ricciae]CAF0743904.1 unnamed protein product [Adineta ricciae]
MSASILPAHDRKSYLYRHATLDSILDEEDEGNLDETTLPQVTSTADISSSLRPWSNLPINTIKTPQKRFRSQMYKYIQLEESLQSANLLNTNEERQQFQQDYQQSIRERKFDKFLQTYYHKLRTHKQTLDRERAMKKSRTFTFANLDKNFIASDPTRDIKIVFVNNPRTLLRMDMTNARSTNFNQQNTEEIAVETFYENLSRRFLNNPSRARDEITLFARQTSERLHETIPYLSQVPYRVRLVDERDKEHPLDERTILQMKHQRNLSVIEKRRQKIMKMITQTRNHQVRMKQIDKRTPLSIDNSIYCQELLERVQEIEQSIKEKPCRTQSIAKKTNSIYSSPLSPADTERSSSSLLFVRRSPRFQENALSMYHIENADNIRIIESTRPLTTPGKKLQWMNYT